MLNRNIDLNGLSSMDLHEIVLQYLVIINIATVIIYGWDKLCAIKRWWRVPEITLLVFAAIGGSIGALLGMRIFHHKTLHLKFKYGVPVILMLQLAGLVWLHTPSN